jgi:uncharacterized protein
MTTQAARHNDEAGFHFRTDGGTWYYYDDCDGSVQVAEDVKKTGAGKRRSTKKQVANPTPDPTLRLSFSAAKITAANVERHLRASGFRQLILVVTQDCNLRCRYCAYSGYYENMRAHCARSMTVEVAEEALKRYFEAFAYVKRRNPYRIPTVSFYGGEPMMNFGLIRHIVGLAKALYPGDILFNITTNATTLTAEMIDFLHANDVILSISLNGPQEEHDRLRVFPDGRGTFNIVWNALQGIKERYPDYYKERVNLLACYDSGTNLEEVASFFQANEAILPLLGKVSPVSVHFTDWYSRYTSQQKLAFARSRTRCRESYLAALLSGKEPPVYLEALFGTAFRMVLIRPQNTPFRVPFLPYTGACVPGDKIAVDPEGNFHACEKVNEQFPIGNVEEGINLEAVVSMLNLYRTQIMSGCVGCPITRLCPLCYAVVGGNGRFERNPSGLCESIKRDVKDRFEVVWSLFEAGIEEDAMLKESVAPFPDF